MIDVDNAYRFTTDLWRFFREHVRAENTDEYWEQSMEAAGILEQRYGANKYMHAIICDVIESLREEAQKNAE